MAEVNLPEGWAVTTLENVAVWGSGGTPSRKESAYYDGNVPWVKTGDLGPRVLYNSSEFISELAVQNSSAKYFPKGSVAIAMYGATIGKTSILGIDATTNQACGVGNPIEGITFSEFLYYFLINEKDNFIAKGKGGAQPNISQALIKEHEIALPPLAEQKVIAEKLDSLLAQVDNTKARLERIPEILKRFRQSVLAAAVSGKLTEEWRETVSCGSVIEYLKAIENERLKLVNAKKLKKSTLPRTAVEQSDSELPKSWVQVNFEHIAAYDNNALKAGPFGSALKKSDCTDAGYRVYGQEQVIAGDENLVTYYINESKFNDLSSCAVDADDILVSLVGTIGKVLILSDDAEKGIINPRLVKLSLQPEVNRKYIQFYLQSIVALDFFKGFSHGGTMDILNLGILKDLPINFPPIEEQTEIVRRVEELFTFADRIEQAAQAALSRVNNLTQSILAKAFRGELTADWRAANSELISGENSAEALLARIKAERAKVSIKKSRKVATVD